MGHRTDNVQFGAVGIGVFFLGLALIIIAVQSLLEGEAAFWVGALLVVVWCIIGLMMSGTRNSPKPRRR